MLTVTMLLDAVKFVAVLGGIIGGFIGLIILIPWAYKKLFGEKVGKPKIKPTFLSMAGGKIYVNSATRTYNKASVIDGLPDRGRIGIAGKSWAGKDTVRDMLIECLEPRLKEGVIRLGFSNKLKEIACEFFKPEQVYNQAYKEEVDDTWGITPRQFMITFGNDFIMPVMGKKVWAIMLGRTILKKNITSWIVAADVRWPHDAEFICKKGWNICVVRPDQKKRAVHLHKSEHGIPAELVDIYIINDGSLEDLREKVEAAADYLLSIILRNKGEI